MKSKKIEELGLDKEMFFCNPREIFLKFNCELQEINNCENEVIRNIFIQKLSKKYMKALVSLPDTYEALNLKSVYKDILIILGHNDYVLEEEINSYNRK